MQAQEFFACLCVAHLFVGLGKCEGPTEGEGSMVETMAARSDGGEGEGATPQYIHLNHATTTSSSCHGAKTQDADWI